MSHIIGKGRYARLTYPVSPGAASPNLNKVKVDAADTTADFLTPKIVAGSGIALAVLNPGGNEQLQISSFGTNRSFQLLAPYALPSVTPALDSATATTLVNPWSYFVTEFNAGSLTVADVKFFMPLDWNGGAIKCKTSWDGTTASVGNVVWGFAARAYADGDTIDQAAGGAVEVTSTYNGAGKMNLSPMSADITIAGSLSPGNQALLQIYRKGTAGDTFPDKVRNLAILVSYGAT